MENSSEQTIKKELEEPYSNVLYVADLPNETTIDDLQKLFEDYHFHYASLNNFKLNQIYAQVYLENKEWATKARHELNGVILKPMNGANSIKEGKPIRICKYQAKGQNKQTNIKQSLLVKNIDSQMSQKEFYEKFLEYGDIVSGKIEYDENGISKGFGYIYYYTEESAENAKKNLNGKFFYGKALDIVNLIPGKKNKSNAITLFVLNIPKNITEKDISNIFEKFGPVSNISVNERGFAYVSYTSFEAATQCLKELKANPITFPGLPDVVVKFASSKEERDANKIFAKNNDSYNFGFRNLNVQFNSVYYNENIKTDLDLDQEIRLFIKVVMLMDFSPKEVLIDLETFSGLVQFEKYHDYNLFFKKYQEYCEKQIPLFECIPYNYPFPTEENQNTNENVMTMYNNNSTPMYNGPEGFRPMPRPFNYPHTENNFRNMSNNNFMFPNRNNNMQNFQNIYQGKNNNMTPFPNMQYPQNFSQKNNNKIFNGGNNNNGFGNFDKNNYMNNMNNINRNNKMQNYNNQNNNKRFNQRNNFANNMNNRNINFNINNNNNRKQIIRPGDNINLANMRMNMNNINNMNLLRLYQMNNPFMRQQMMQMNQRNRNIQNMNQNNNNDYAEMNQKNELDLYAQRNLESLNPSQLHSQFNKPPINVYANMLDSKEQEEIRMEIADSIYEIVYAKYPNEASKITGMINEKGIEKMNMLLSKKEDLDDIIDKAYEMIKKSENDEKNSG